MATIALSSVCGAGALCEGVGTEVVSGARVCPPINAIVAFSFSLYVDTVANANHDRVSVCERKRKRLRGRTWSIVVFHHRPLVYQLERAYREVGIRRQVGTKFSQRRVERWDWEMEEVAIPFDVNHVVKGMAGTGGGTRGVLDKDGTNECEYRTENQHKAERDWDR